MRRASIISLLVGVPLVLLIFWIASNTYWADMTLPMPPKGEAVINPFYAVQRFAEALGARTAWDRVLAVPPADSVIVLSAWHWSLSRGRRDALERWVASGGRLVVDRALVDREHDFERWSGIVHEYREQDEAQTSAEQEPEDACRSFQEEQDGTPSPGPRTTGYRMCDLDGVSSLTSKTNAAWALRDTSGIQAMRVRSGRGSVTVINVNPFRYRKLFDGDHGWLFVAAAQLRRGDEVHFVSEENHVSLLALIWQYGAPVVVLALALVALSMPPPSAGYRVSTFSNPLCMYALLIPLPHTHSVIMGFECVLFSHHLRTDRPRSQHRREI